VKWRTTVDFSELGFREIGECKLDEELESGVRFRVNEMYDERVVYAFTIDGEVKYIGICEKTKTTLKERMMRYQGRVGSTNKRIAESIKDCLMDGKKVRILALKPDTGIEFKGLRIDLVKGLENPLIQEAVPEWNIRW
jgi:hypothetical protein